MSEQNKEVSLSELLNRAKRKHQIVVTDNDQLKEELLNEWLTDIPDDVLLPVNWSRYTIDEQLFWVLDEYCKVHPSYMTDFIRCESDKRVAKRKELEARGIRTEGV